MRFEPWVYVVEHGTLRNGQPNRVWLRQDGMGKWLVLQHLQMSPEFYLTADATWTDRATNDTRHSEHDARSLALVLVASRAEQRTCSHCRGPMRGVASLSYANVTHNLCHPDDGMDCYRLVTAFKHPVVDCPCTTQPQEHS